MPRGCQDSFRPVCGRSPTLRRNPTLRTKPDRCGQKKWRRRSAAKFREETSKKQKGASALLQRTISAWIVLRQAPADEQTAVCLHCHAKFGYDRSRWQEHYRNRSRHGLPAEAGCHAPISLTSLRASRARRGILLIAPTGGGKTLAGFLPSLIDLAATPHDGLHTLYISPLKALATDIARNLTAPVANMALPVTIGTRTGDTGSEARRRQRESPPNLLLTTPESLALLVTLPDAERMFAGLRTVVIDEIHALAGTKRGDQLGLCLARLGALAPDHRRIGLSATVPHRQPLVDFVSLDGRGGDVELIEGKPGAPPRIGMILPQGRLPWSGHMGLFSAPDILARIGDAGMTIVFVNTRAQAELLFQELWRLNAETLPIAIHHGSLELEQRHRVEAAMAQGALRAVVATSSLDLGIDWGGVDQVLQVGAPKGVSRLLQRVGRANHRMDEASRALLVPANRFEVLGVRGRHARRRGRRNWTATRPAPAAWTFSPSICWAVPAPAPTTRTPSSRRSAGPPPMPG